MIILRSDGTPTYNFAVVVDDHDMGITHVIRGVDHLTNAARQVQIYKAMGWDVPVFAHVPLIHGPDGAKLSKRHGALGIEAYRAMGFLPAGLRNYLVRLGWSHGDDEIFSTEQAIAWFDIGDINKSPGRLDFAKLADVNSHYIRQASDAELIRRIKELLPELPDGAEIAARIEKAGWDRLATALPSLKERAKTLNDLLAGAGYLLATRPLALDDKAAKLLDAEARASLGELLPQLEAATDWQVPALEAAGPRLCRGDRAEARQSCAAAARRAHRQRGVSAGVRRHGGAGPRGGAGAHPRPGRLVTKLLPAAMTPGRTGLFFVQCMACRSAIDILLRVSRRSLQARHDAAEGTCAVRSAPAAADRRTSPMNAKDLADAGKSATLTRWQQSADASAGAIGQHRPGRDRRRPALPRHRLLHLRSGLHVHRQLLLAHHLHRRRQGRAALSRLPHRAAGAEIELPRGLLPPAQRRSADQDASTRISAASSRATPWCTSR